MVTSLAVDVSVILSPYASRLRPPGTLIPPSRSLPLSRQLAQICDMEYRTLEVTVLSAKDLQDVNLFSKMDVYVVVSLSGNSQHKLQAKTNVDREGGKNPSWNFPMKFTINEFTVRQNRLTLEFKLRCDRSLGDKDIGNVCVPVQELLDSTGDGKSMQFVRYQVTKPSGKPKGELYFSYKFSENVSSSEPLWQKTQAYEPVTAYPSAPVVEPSAPPYDGLYPIPDPPPPAGYSYAPPPPPPPYQPYAYWYPPPPPPPGYGYPPPPPTPPGYGYPPPPGYAYPPVQQPRKQNKFGMGLGAGVVGGLLGGLLLGDLGGC
ncbi:hypothetical protein CJ030_MR5G017277 [Morella rubra]|uniref:C2 domain-containing protein n=1 Tax=Morella rubra TaxID=262757 RepID=A0A6A1VMH8_9ROSI|nr:hypothetical protein CJ030_MR5G017277 [Morella rubra]